MRLTKKVPYKLKALIPALGLAGASMFSACESNEPVIKQHDTIYTFGPGNWFDAQEEQNIIASADSATVRYVVLESNGEAYHGSDSFIIRANIMMLLDNIPEKNLYKMKGSGILRDVNIQSKEDSIYLTDFGFVFADAINYAKQEQKQR